LKAGADPNPAVNFTSGQSLVCFTATSSEMDSYYTYVLLLLHAGANRLGFTDPNLYQHIRSGNNIQIEELLKKWPSVVSLQDLCRRKIHFGKNKPEIPEWFPSLLLKWDGDHY